MKRVAIGTLFFLLCGLTGLSQFYFRAGGGAGIGFPYNDTAYSNTITRIYYTMINDYPIPTSTTVANKKINSTYGTGLNGFIALDWMISRYLGVEIAFCEFYGGSVKETDSIYYEDPVNNWAITEETRWGLMFQVIPSVILTPGFNKINPYARLGLILGVVPQFYQKGLANVPGINKPDRELYAGTNYYYGGIPVGFAGTLGADFKITRVTAFYAELIFHVINYSPKKITPEDNTLHAPPRNLVGLRQHFSNFQMNVGVRFLLGK